MGAEGQALLQGQVKAGPRLLVPGFSAREIRQEVGLRNQVGIWRPVQGTNKNQNEIGLKVEVGGGNKDSGMELLKQCLRSRFTLGLGQVPSLLEG